MVQTYEKKVVTFTVMTISELTLYILLIDSGK